MTSAALVNRNSDSKRFSLCALLLSLVAAVLAGCAPISVSVMAVFLFAGPHNWLEFQYFISRLPSRWGPFRSFFLSSFCGIPLLTLAYLGLVASGDALSGQTAAFAYSGWYSSMILWVVSLSFLRSRQRPHRDWSIYLPLAFLLLSAAWASPSYFGLALVFLHPLMGLFILDREIVRKRPTWRSAYHKCLWLIPVCLLLIWTFLNASGSGIGSDPISARTVQHAGCNLLPDLPAHLLVATHVFLELLHYGVWMIAIPIASGILRNWNVGNVPIAQNSSGWKSLLITATTLSTALVLLLWFGLAVDYATIRDVYFTVAMVHVLAEVPLLLWSI